MTLPPRGLVIGKFLPLTTGHCFLIESARAQCEQLTVLLGSLSSEPISGHLRFNWLRDTFSTRDFPDIRCVHAAEDVPQYPHEHPDFWNIWRDLIARHAGPVDVVFSSEDYGEKLAQVLAARHMMIDRDRRTVPISATQVRAAPLQNWQFLPPAVRAHYARRILIFGPESTGKSTLAAQLAAHFQTRYVPEWARVMLEARDNLCRESDIPAIVSGQMQSEEQGAHDCNKLLFCDTDVVTTTIYARHFYGDCAPWVQRLADERINGYDLILFCDIDLPWQDDPQRDINHARDDFRRHFCDLFLAELQSRRLPFHIVRGQGSARLQNAIEVVERELELNA